MGTFQSALSPGKLFPVHAGARVSSVAEIRCMLPNFRKTENEALKPEETPPRVTRASSPPPTRPQSPTAARASDRSAPSIIGHDLQITGNMVSKGEIQIDGEIQGDIRSNHVIVGEKALITGSIAADEIVIRGKVMGSVRGKRVLLQTSSHVEGDIYHQALAIEQGAFFEGKSRRSSEPLAEGGTTASPPPQPPTEQNSSTAAPSAPPTAPPSPTNRKS